VVVIGIFQKNEQSGEIVDQFEWQRGEAFRQIKSRNYCMIRGALRSKAECSSETEQG